MKAKEINNIYKVGGAREPASVELKSTDWAVLTQMDGNKTIAEIADTLAMSEAEILSIVENLNGQQLIEKIGSGKKAVEYIAPEFFDELEHVLIRLIGPVGVIIIDDILIDLKKEKDSVEKEYISTLVEAISDEIDDEGKKLSFQQTMLGKLHNF